MLIFADYVPVLVRKLEGSQPGHIPKVISTSDTAPRTGCDTHHRISQVGSNNFDYDPGCSERHPPGSSVRVEVEADQPKCEGQAWQRISTSDSRTDARQQVPGRQHIHQQDMGGGIWNLGSRGPHYGG